METKKIKKTPSTLLIPKKDMGVLYQRLKQKDMKLKEYFAYLLRKYRFAKGLLNRFASSKIKKQYQSKGLDLQKKNFIPENHTWQELSQLASALGLSKTHTFMILFYLDIGRIENHKNFLENRGVPINKRGNIVIVLHERLNLTIKTYKRSLRLII